MNDLSGSVVVLLELNQVRGLLIEVYSRQRIAIIRGLLENRAGRFTVHAGLSRQGADALNQFAITIGEAEARPS